MSTKFANILFDHFSIWKMLKIDYSETYIKQTPY